MILALAALLVSTAEVDHTARFLAGLDGSDDSPYKTLEHDQRWLDHKTRMDDLWSKFARRRKPAMDAFQTAELAASTGAVWYPFSGPDALTMSAFFPGRTTYVMAALEPPGTVPTQAEVKRRLDQLPALADTLSSALRESFFVTQEMDRELRGQVTDGVAVLLLMQLVRMGETISGFRYVQLDDAGKIVEREKDQKRAAFGHNLALEISVGAARTVTYVSLNLDDGHMKDNAAFKAFVTALGRPATLLKATSYMLHEPQFSVIRDLILEQSALIVQDDSGIPWRLLAGSAWQVQLYGEYSKPYGSFHFRFQPDLRAAYLADKPKPLQFAVGYGAGRITSNLQIARRK